MSLEGRVLANMAIRIRLARRMKTVPTDPTTNARLWLALEVARDIAPVVE